MNRLAIGIMVKNESHIIERCLTSILKVADLVVITDTGSTDDTIIKAGLFLQRHNIKFKIYMEKFTDFSTNRNLVLQRVQETGEADYCLMIDADEEFKAYEPAHIQEFKDALVAKGYQIKMNSGLMSFYLPRLTRCDAGWFYKGVTHEYLEQGDDECPYNTKIEIFQHTDSHRRNTNQKVTNDIELLEEAIKTADKELRARYAFYLAQSYHNLGDDEKALKYYQIRIDEGGWEEEIFFSHWSMGKILEKQNTELAAKHYLLAYEACPRRIESLHDLRLLWDRQGLKNLSSKLLIPLLQTIKHPGKGLFLEDYKYYIYGS